jgi:hypothetical protein
MSISEETPAPRWLQHFPQRYHAMLNTSFRHVIRQGATTPDEVLMKLNVLLGQKQAWSTTPETRELVAQALVGLRCEGAREVAAWYLAQAH